MDDIDERACARRAAVGLLARPVLVDAVVLVVCYLQGFENQTPGWNRPFVLSVAALVAVALRRWQPEACLLVGAAGLGWAQSTLSVVVLLFTVGDRQRRGWSVCALAAATLALSLWPLWDPGQVGNNTSMLITQTALVAGSTGLGALGRARRTERAQRRELERSNAREAQLVDAAARADERAHLAREMHDVVAHHVSLVSVQAGALQMTTREESTREVAAVIRQSAAATIQELRQVLAVMRAAGSLTPADAVQAPRGLDDLAELWRTAGADGTFQLDPQLLRASRAAPRAASPALAPAVQRTTYRVVQEGLTNARKHAPGAPVDVSVTLVGSPAGRIGGQLSIEVRTGPASRATGDQRPSGATPSAGGHGLRGLRERVEALDGCFTAGLGPGGHHHLAVRLPLQ